MEQAPSALPALDLLTVSDLCVDLVLRGNVRPRFGQVEQLIGGYHLDLGGSANIFAAQFARLGGRAGVLGYAGRDAFGGLARERLIQTGVDVSRLHEHPELPTGLGTALAEPHDRATLTCLGTIDATQPEDLMPALSGACRHWHIASYFLLTRLRSTWPKWLALLRERGVTVSLDTNWDPAERWDGVLDLLPLVDVLLLNENEALAISGASNVQAAGAKLAAHGPLTVIKCGADGAVAFDKDRRKTVRVPGGPAPKIVDSVGAGDCFDAGFLRAWQLGHALEDCLVWGNRCGAASLAAPGGIDGQLRETIAPKHGNRQLLPLIPDSRCSSRPSPTRGEGNGTAPLEVRMPFLDSLRRHRDAGHALLAANFYNAETLLAVLRAARATSGEIILQTSPSTIEYLGGVTLTAAMARAAAQQLDVTAWLHLDHAADAKLIEACVAERYDSVMIDASESDFATNVRRTRETVALAHARGVAVEAELGYVPKLGQTGVTEAGLTTPAQAAEFAAATGVDLLAVAIGTAHGFYKKPPKLDYERLSAIRKLVDAPLVLHGGSGVDPEAWQEAIRRGIAKINFATEIKDTFTRAVKQTLVAGDEIDLRKTFPPAMQAVTDLVAAKIQVCQMTGVST